MNGWFKTQTLIIYKELSIEKTVSIEREFEFLYDAVFMQVQNKYCQLIYHKFIRFFYTEHVICTHATFACIALYTAVGRGAAAPKTCTGTAIQGNNQKYLVTKSL